MNCVEINPVGNFTTWDPTKVSELRNKKFSASVGQLVLFENTTVRLWESILKPFERIPFHRRASNYSWTALTEGLAITRNINGKISLIKLEKGDTGYWEFEGKEIIVDFENIGENTIKILEYIPNTNKNFVFI